MMRPVSHNKMSLQPSGITAVLEHFTSHQTNISFSGLMSPCLISQGDPENKKNIETQSICVTCN